MIARCTGLLKRALRLNHPGRSLVVFPDDTFLVSYPKSGNTWARFLIGNLISPDHTVDFRHINSIIPDPEIASRKALSRTPRPRLIKSHQYFDPRYKRVIYIVRDPRDVVVSQYHFQRKRRLLPDDYPLEKYVEDFVNDETCSYGTWAEHVASWVATRHRQGGFLLLRYEDMIADTADALAKIASFLGIAADANRLSRAIEKSSADRMRKLERSQAQQFSSTKNTRQDIPFVRAAQAGGWQSVLPRKLVEEIESAWGPLMQSLGYKLVTSPAPQADNLDSLSVLNSAART